jgi:hypothetical protein
MIVLNRITLAFELIAVIAGLSYFGLLEAIILRLRRLAAAEGLDKLSFSESVPVPHGKVVEQYCQQFPRSRALKALGILYRTWFLGMLVWGCLWMLTQIIS